MTADDRVAPLDEASTRVLARILPDDDTPDVAALDRFRMVLDRIAADNGPGPQMRSVTEHLVPGSPHPVRVVLLEPVPEPRGVVVSLGLGGWVGGSPAVEETLARKVAERTTCAVALIDHRRAPEHPCPAAADDVQAAVHWLWSNREALGIGPGPMMILGEGMGATLAAATVERTRRDPDGPRFALQFLVCPVTDPPVSDGDVPCAPLLSREALQEFWAGYLPDHPLRVDLDVGPSNSQEAGPMPPTVIVTAEHDVAYRDGIELTRKLRAAGLPVAHRHYDGQIHGFFGILALPAGERALQHVVRAVRGHTARFGELPPPDPAELGRWLERIIK